MALKIKRNVLEQSILSLLLLVSIALVLIGVSFTTSYVFGVDNTTNRTIIAKVNVTNTEPNITSIRVDDGIPSIPNERMEPQ